MTNYEWKVSAQDAGNRLDKFITQKCETVSRSKIQKWIKQEAVTVNGKQETKHYAVEEHDVISIDVPEEQEDQITAVPIPVIYEDDDIVVINKPTGVLVHPAEGAVPGYCVTDWLIQHYPSAETVTTDDSNRPGIVHRLDRPVSGIMVVAKTQAALQELQRQFKERQVQKEYIAFVHGAPVQDAGTIRFAIGNSKTHRGKMAARPEHEEGKDAWTEYDVLNRMKDERYAALRIGIKTGRTHQIRAHLAAIDHPILGDALYGNKRLSSKNKEYSRILLHAYRLGFAHPTTGEQVEWVAPLPQSFKGVEGLDEIEGIQYTA